MTNKKRSKTIDYSNIKECIESYKNKPLSQKVVLAEVIMGIYRNKNRSFKYDDDDILWAKGIIEKANKSKEKRRR